MTSAAAILEKAHAIVEIDQQLTEARGRVADLQRERLECLAALKRFTSVTCRDRRVSSIRFRVGASIPQRIMKQLGSDEWQTIDQIHAALGSPHLLSLRAALCRLVKAGKIERSADGGYRVAAQREPPS